MVGSLARGVTALGAFALLASAPPDHAWRLRYIDLSVTVDPPQRAISGASRLTFTRPAGRTPDLVLDLGDSITLDSAALDGASATGVRGPGIVRFPAGSLPGTRVVVTAWFHGRPVRAAVGFAPGGNRVASYGVPRSARQWWPVPDDPSQKADSADIRITAPASLSAVSNGRLVARATAPGDLATSHWTVRHPIYPDVVSFAVGDYVVTRDTVRLARGPVPLEFYVFPEDTAKAATDFAAVPAILQFYDSILGPYPFGDEKYALVEFTRPSFREGQTLTHLGANLITGRGTGEQVVAHEVAHQWFGNSLTVRGWEDIWLNESLSEFMAWQWMRRAHGDSTYLALVDSGVSGRYEAPIAPANPDNFGSLFGAATFSKGPVVLAMLRGDMGTAAFDRALRAYVREHAYGLVSSSDFERACERSSGRDLGWFFDRYVRGTAPLSRARATGDSPRSRRG